MSEARDPLERLGRLKHHLEAELSERDVERLVHGGAERRQRRQIRRTLATGLVLGAVTTAAVLVFLRAPWNGAAIGAITSARPPASGAPSVAAAVPASPSASSLARADDSVRLRDASRATPLEPQTALVVEEDEVERVRLRLDRGRAHFEVTRRPERSFSVRASNVTVSVVGTTFDVEVVADRVGVSVATGVVEVDWGVGQKRLLAGERGWFPPLVMGESSPASVPERPAAPLGGSAKPSTAASVSASVGSFAPSAQTLLAEVDAARSRGEPDHAVELLRQILRDYPRDPRSPLAAFTLGRVLLNELGRPRDAAAAFHQVRVNAPSSQFAEDALAREVEAWSRASEPERARSLAKTYLEKYPSGRHAPRLKSLTGLP